MILGKIEEIKWWKVFKVIFKKIKLMWWFSNSELLKDNCFFDDILFFLYILYILKYILYILTATKINLYKLKILNKNNIIILNILIFEYMNGISQWLYQKTKILRLYIYLIHKVMNL